MTNKHKQRENFPILVIHSTDSSFGFGYRKNNIFTNKKSFWIYKKLKRKGLIAGKYEICHKEKNSSDLVIRETVLPKVVKELENKELTFEANYDDKEDLKELLNLANKNLLNSNLDSWRKVLPLYPISPIN